LRNSWIIDKIAFTKISMSCNGYYDYARLGNTCFSSMSSLLSNQKFLPPKSDTYNKVFVYKNYHLDSPCGRNEYFESRLKEHTRYCPDNVQDCDKYYGEKEGYKRLECKGCKK